LRLTVFSFSHFHPKNACQALKPLNPLQIINIRVAYQFHSTRLVNMKLRKAEAPTTSLG